ncbi:MAG: FHA domain-containing protein [Planctomycetota bacterium]
MVTADGGERPFPLTAKRIVLGRDLHCDLRVALPSVANRHCEIVSEGGVLTVQDLGSEIGTVHNGARVEQAILAPNDRLTVGPVTFVVRADRSDDTSPETLAEVKPQRREVSRGAPSDGPRGASQPGAV